MNYCHIQHRDTYIAYQELWYLFPIKRIMILLQYVCARINLCASLWLKKKKTQLWMCAEHESTSSQYEQPWVWWERTPSRRWWKRVYLLREGRGQLYHRKNGRLDPCNGMLLVEARTLRMSRGASSANWGAAGNRGRKLISLYKKEKKFRHGCFSDQIKCNQYS